MIAARLARLAVLAVLLLAITAVPPAAAAPAWVDLGGGPQLSGDNAATGPSLATFADRPHVAFTDHVGVSTIAVARYAGPPSGAAPWQRLPGSPDSNPASGGSAHPEMAVVGGSLHVVWPESDGQSQKIRVARFDNNTQTWTELPAPNPNPAPNPINISATNNGFTPAIADVGGVPHVAWWEQPNSCCDPPTVHVKRFNGTAWVELGTGPSGVGVGTEPDIASIGGVPHVVYQDRDNEGDSGVVVTVKRYVSATNTWAQVGSGANPISTYGAARFVDDLQPALSAVGGTPYVAWTQPTGAGGVLQVRVKRFNGSSWEQPGGASLNRDAADQATETAIHTVAGQPHVAWVEDDGTNTEVRVRRLDGSSWTELGGGDSPVNRSSEADALAVDLGSVGSIPVVAWDEGPVPPATERQVYVAAYGDGPANTARPQLTGTPKVGSNLSCSDGSWDGNPSRFTKTWERAPRATTADDDPAWGKIDGASGDTYTVQAADEGSRLRCRVIAETDLLAGEAVSTSLRANRDVPVNTAAPVAAGTPNFNHVMTCEAGSWEHGPDFSYQWLRDGEPIPGATEQKYRPRLSRYPFNPRAEGDGNHYLSCRVTGRNDLGESAPATSPQVFAYDYEPFLEAPPVLTGPSFAVGATVTCEDPPAELGDRSKWIDGYGERGIEGYSLSWQWFRNGELIAGAGDRGYRLTTEDLGRQLACQIVNRNPIGPGYSKRSAERLIPLPEGDRRLDFLRVGGKNQADPTNLLPVTWDYRDVVNRLTVQRLRAAIPKVLENCPSGGKAPTQEQIFGKETDKAYPAMTRTLRCRLLQLHPEKIEVNNFGVFYQDGSSGECYFDSYIQRCRNLRIKIAPVDPKKPNLADPEATAELAPVTPERFLWDIDRDGDTDASCPGTAPVLRTIYQGKGWNPRVVVVLADSAETGVFFARDLEFDAHPKAEKAKLRPGQVKVCATAFDPPPDPQTRPCVTEAEIGRVRVTGNLCPIDLRKVDEADFNTFDGDLRSTLLAQSEHRLTSEGIATARRGNSTEPIWVEAVDPDAGGDLRTAMRRMDDGPFGPRITKADALEDKISAAYSNTAASFTSYGNPLPRDPSDKLKEKLEDIPSFDVPNAQFALDQIYASRGQYMQVNGMAVDPRGDTAALLVPSDVSNAINQVKGMKLHARDAASYLGDPSGIPLAAQGELKRELKDAATSAGSSLLRETNLDSLASDLKKRADNLVKPFKLRGTAKVEMNNDGTVTLSATAVLPSLKLGAGSKSTEASASIKLKGDREGRITLEGLRLKPPGLAYLGGVALKDLDVSVGNGLDVKGSILFPPPIGAGIAINRFRLGSEGDFQELDVDYLAGAGTGIKVGPGVFVTRLGGRLCLVNCEVKGKPGEVFDDIIGGRAALSVGPSPGGGCPTAGIDASFTVHFAEQFFVDARGDIQLACIDLAQLRFYAEQSGFVTLNGQVDKTLGPLFFKGGIDVSMLMPDWQATFNGTGGIDLPSPFGRTSLSYDMVLSNLGLAGCVTFENFIKNIRFGAAVRFIDGRPPLTQTELLANLRIDGCNLSKYKSVVRRASLRGAQAGATSFEVPKGTGPSFLSIEGAEGAPRVRLRSPSGQVLDFTDADQQGGKTVAPAFGAVVEEQDRTIVVMNKIESGTWTVELGEGSPAVARIQRADILPDPKVGAKVRGKGTRRTLSYEIKPKVEGQTVRFFEKADGARKLLRTVKRGGSGSVPFTVSEANGRSRTIEAEVVQDGVPRATLTVARFSAPSPKVGQARVTVRRRKKTAVITWTTAPFASGYEVVVLTGTGRRMLLQPSPKKRSVTVKGIGPKEGVVVQVVGFSPSGTRGKYAKGRLQGSMRVGDVRRRR